MLQFVRKVVAEHKEQLDPEHPKDLIDSYLLEIEKMKNEEEHQGEKGNRWIRNL